jgi:hypothetical protein
VISFSVVAMTGIFLGFYPTRKAARLDLIDALLRVTHRRTKNPVISRMPTGTMIAPHTR